MQMFYLHTTWCKKIQGFLTFSRGIEMEQWQEMGSY